jgi:sulfate transport system substrate-binding protein
LILSLPGCSGQAKPQTADEIEIVNVSYDPTRELYEELNLLFTADYHAKTGKKVKVTQSHGGSGAQARAVIDGLKADVVSLALAGDIDAIAKNGLIHPGWETRLEQHAAPFTSVIVFVVRKDNPKNIKNWDDLVAPDVKIITPNPKTSGGARWNFLAAWGYATWHKKDDDDEARDFVGKLYRNAVKLDTGARGSAQSFIKNKLGDVFLAWESEALQIAQETEVEIIYPSATIHAEPPVALVDQYADERGTRAVAEAYLQFHYSDQAQAVIGKHGYRPRNPIHAQNLPPVKTFTIRDVAGDWEKARQRFFAEGGVFDQIYRK